MPKRKKAIESAPRRLIPLTLRGDPSSCTAAASCRPYRARRIASMPTSPRIFCWCSRYSTITRPKVVARPAAATMMPACPRLAPGSKATSAMTRVLTSAENAAPARTWCSARA